MFARPEQRCVAMDLVFLDPDETSSRAREFEERLASRVVGQERAVRGMSSFYQVFLAGLNQSDRPIGTMLLLGPTGCGKTHDSNTQIQKRQFLFTKAPNEISV